MKEVLYPHCSGRGKIIAPEIESAAEGEVPMKWWWLLTNKEKSDRVFVTYSGSYNLMKK